MSYLPTIDYDYDAARRHNWAWFIVRIEKPGPRGGKRPPLIEGRLRALNYDEAVATAKRAFWDSTDITVKW